MFEEEEIDMFLLSMGSNFCESKSTTASIYSAMLYF
jgi:hypothetical protein